MRRALVGVVLVFAVGCGGTAPEETASVSQEVKVCANGPVIEGIDISHWQDTIDWPSVKADGVDFALAKATEHTTYSDPTFDYNRAEAKAAGLAFGAYHFFRSDDDPTAQAQHFASALGTVEVGEISPVLDLETADGESAGTIVSRAVTFLAVLESLTGRVPIIYTSPSFFESTLGAPAELAGYPLWIANWETTCPTVPTAWADWSLWQYTDSGSVAGIGGPVDRDQFDGTVEDLKCVGVVCPSGECQSGVCSGASTGGTGGGGGIAGSPASGGSGGTPEIGGAGGMGAEAGAAGAPIVSRRPASSDDGGCGCKTPERSPSSNGIALLFTTLLAFIVRRRKR